MFFGETKMKLICHRCESSFGILILKVYQSCRQSLSISIIQITVQECWILCIKWCAWILSYEYVISSFVLLKACFTALLNIWLSAEWDTISLCFFFCSSMLLLFHIWTCWSGWTSSSRLSSRWSAFSRSLPSALWWEWRDSDFTFLILFWYSNILMLIVSLQSVFDTKLVIRSTYSTNTYSKTVKVWSVDKKKHCTLVISRLYHITIFIFQFSVINAVHI